MLQIPNRPSDKRAYQVIENVFLLFFSQNICCGYSKETGLLSNQTHVLIDVYGNNYTAKPVENGHSQKDHKLVFKTNYRLMQFKSIAECSNGSILQYFRPVLSNHLSFRSLFVYF